jgi:hypothetical protein
LRILRYLGRIWFILLSILISGSNSSIITGIISGSISGIISGSINGIISITIYVYWFLLIPIDPYWFPIDSLLIPYWSPIDSLLIPIDSLLIPLDAIGFLLIPRASSPIDSRWAPLLGSPECWR